jgi:ComF family protein
VAALTLATRIVPKAWELLLDFVYPPRCGGCDVRGTWFCSDCIASLAPPSDGERVAGISLLVCGGAFKERLRTAIHNFKYEGDTPLAKPLAALVHGALTYNEAWEEKGHAPVLMPVPLHPQRECARGFNQSYLLARELSRLTGWEVDRRLVREKNTRSQVGLNALERRENMKDAFVWRGDAVPARVMLVDDVCTTGATLSECTATLLAQGTREVYAVTVGKAVGKGPEAGS